MDVHENDDRTYLLRSEEVNATRTKRKKTKEASRKRKGFILACCVMSQVVSNGVGFGLGVMYVEIQRVFNAPRTEAALVQSIFMGIMTAGGILYNPFIKRYGTGVCVCAGTVIGCIGLTVSSFSTQIYTVIILTGVVGGLGLSINYFAPFVTVSLLFQEKAGVPLVFLTTGASIGQFIYPYMYEIFISEYGWGGAFLLVASISLHCVPAGLIVYTSRDYLVSTQDERGKTRESGDQRCCQSCDTSLLSDIMILLILSTCFLLAATGNTESWFLVDLMTIRGYERQTGALFVSLIGFFNFFGRLTGVLIRFKLKTPTIYNWIYCMPVIGISHFLIIYFTDYVPLLLSCVLYGYTFGITVAQTPAVMFEAAGLKRYASGMGLVNFMFGGGNFFGGFIGGIINDNFGGYDPVFYLAMAASMYMCLASTVVVLIMKRRKSREVNVSHQTNTKYASTGYSLIKEESC